MRLSWSGKWLFLSFPKCGSTSIRRVLDPFADIKPHREEDGWHPHLRVSNLVPKLKGMGYDWDEFLSFTTIRNPWDRVVSCWEYGGRDPQSVWAGRRAKAGTFEAFVENFPPQATFARFATEEPGGPQRIKHVVPIEAASEQLPGIFEKIGVPWEPLPHLNTSPRVNDQYRSYYTAETQAMVAEFCWLEIEIGRYRF